LNEASKIVNKTKSSPPKIKIGYRIIENTFKSPFTKLFPVSGFLILPISSMLNCLFNVSGFKMAYNLNKAAPIATLSPITARYNINNKH